jgi:DNA-binding CsgD family transcriptional regulator
MYLSADDTSRLTAALRVLGSPTEAASPHVWMSAVNETVRALLGGERAIFVLGTDRGDELACSEIDRTAIAEYDADYADRDMAAFLVATLEREFYHEADFAHDPRLSAHKATDVYQDWYCKHDLTDALGILVRGHYPYAPDLYARRNLPLEANILITGCVLQTDADRRKCMALLSLIQPSLASAVKLIRATDAVSPDATSILEALDEPIWIFDLAGRCLHESIGALSSGQLLSEDKIRDAANTFARATADAWRKNLPILPARSISLPGTTIRFYASVLPPDGPGGPRILVRIPNTGPAWPSNEKLRATFGLSPRECDVAILRAKGLSMSEIAEQLSVSIHTARRHNEQILSKMGLKRSTEIGPAILKIEPKK